MGIVVEREPLASQLFRLVAIAQLCGYEGAVEFLLQKMQAAGIEYAESSVGRLLREAGQDVTEEWWGSAK